LDSKYFNLEDTFTNNTDIYSNDFIEQLKKNFKRVRDSSLNYQNNVKSARSSKTPQPVGLYQPNDLVLLMLPKTAREAKLSPRNKGPYQVVSQDSNNITIKSLIDQSMTTVDISLLCVFIGNYEQALNAAKYDSDQCEIQEISYYTGDYTKRTTCLFNVIFTDGTTQMTPFTPDLSSTIQFEEFCNQNSHTTLLLKTVKDNDMHYRALSQQPITHVKEHDTVFINIRILDPSWYEKLTLPDLLTTCYFARAEYGSKSRNGKTIKLKLEHARQPAMIVNNWFVVTHGSKSTLGPSDVLLDENHIQAHAFRFPKGK
jgi:hypothetical protein